MSSPPSPRTLEGLVADTWGDEAAERQDVMQLLEPHRADVENLMADFDENTQSWRDYEACIWGGSYSDGAIPRATIQKVEATLKQPAPAAAQSGASPVEARPPEPVPRGDEGRGLRAWWKQDEDDLFADAPQAPDANLTLSVFASNPIYEPSALRPGEPRARAFVWELERRGYDLTTLRFSVQLREHAWIKPGKIVYRQDGGGALARVSWVCWHGSQVTVFFAPPRKPRTDDPVCLVPNEASRFHVPGEDWSQWGMPLAEVERLFQPTPASPREWDPADLPPMFPVRPEKGRAS